MNRAAAVAVAAVATLSTLLGPLSPIASAQGAAVEFASCAKLTAKYPRGVANSVAAATRQYRAGYYRPKVNTAVYLANRRLDRDHDRAACEKRRPTSTTTTSVPGPVDSWFQMPVGGMLPLDVMDFGTGTSLSISNFDTFWGNDGTYVLESPTLTPAATVSGFKGDYYTDAPLAAGQLYTFKVTLFTPAHWSCSIYNPSGCSWRTDTTDVLTYAFTYSADSGVVHTATPVSWMTK